jgi:hypothetical protein
LRVFFGNCGERLRAGATYLSLLILLTSLRHVNVPLPEIEPHCIQIGSRDDTETARAAGGNAEKAPAADFAAGQKPACASYAAQHEMPAD